MSIIIIIDNCINERNTLYTTPTDTHTHTTRARARTHTHTALEHFSITPKYHYLIVESILHQRQTYTDDILYSKAYQNSTLTIDKQCKSVLLICGVALYS